MRFWAISLSLLALVSCKPSMKGALQLTADGTAIPMKSAFFVPTGTESFRVYLSSVSRNCDWAKRRGLGALEDDEVSGAMDVAPVLDERGIVHWHVIGLGWNGRSTMGNVGRVDWPAEVRLSAGQRHIEVDRDSDKHVKLHGDFDAIRCGDAPPVVTPTMTVNAAERTFPITTAWAKPDKDLRWHVRASAGLMACSDDVTGADLFVDFYADPDFTKASNITIQGDVLPERGYQGADDIAVVKHGDDFALDAVVHARPWGAPDGRVLDFSLRGHVPMKTCPVGPR